MSSPNPSSQVSPTTTTSSQPSSPQELRHIISTGALTPQKESTRERKLSAYASQHLGLRVGSRSPTSIPSSPTSVHSSSSAIFERDIEPITPSPPHPSHPHRTPRGKATEQLDHAVPTVLDSAATVLSSPTDDQVIAVVASVTSEFASLSGLSSRLSSRSPSPTHGKTNVPFMNLPSPSPSLTLPLPTHPGVHASQKFNVQTPPAGPNVDAIGAPSPTPTASYFSASVSHEAGTDVQPTPMTVASLEPPQRSSPSVRPVSPLALSHPPSPHVTTKRLSFISYTDLLTSAPSSTLPLSTLTTSATVSDPPPHLLSVLGIPQHVGGGTASASPRTSFYGDRDVREGREGLFLNDVGGEWEREGLGQGLEERLESLMTIRDFDSVGVSKA
ncbi:hypothetical protein BC827DRAFT_1265724 [Russula dissimulans]|nr:hypothetical protein BC827DRAFT_1265724 [Russula dissimulans]